MPHSSEMASRERDSVDDESPAWLLFFVAALSSEERRKRGSAGRPMSVSARRVLFLSLRVSGLMPLLGLPLLPTPSSLASSSLPPPLLLRSSAFSFLFFFLSFSFFSFLSFFLLLRGEDVDGKGAEAACGRTISSLALVKEASVGLRRCWLLGSTVMGGLDERLGVGGDEVVEVGLGFHLTPPKSMAFCCTIFDPLLRPSDPVASPPSAQG